VTRSQAAYWEAALRKATEAPEWKADLEKNFWADDFIAGERLRKELDQDYGDMKAVLVDIGLAK
jgi:tripartite-type tricarboxylate transporter receptor subunit TctC